MVGTSKRTVMVYSDVVEYTLVESGKFPLLHEVQLLRAGEGESTVDPCTTNGSKCEEINWRWPSSPLAKPW